MWWAPFILSRPSGEWMTPSNHTKGWEENVQPRVQHHPRMHSDTVFIWAPCDTVELTETLILKQTEVTSNYDQLCWGNEVRKNTSFTHITYILIHKMRICRTPPVPHVFKKDIWKDAALSSREGHCLQLCISATALQTQILIMMFKGLSWKELPRSPMDYTEENPHAQIVKRSELDLTTLLPAHYPSLPSNVPWS